MSNHRRSSSEVVPTPISELIPIFIDDFKDFDFDDVKLDVAHLFTKVEYDYIAKEECKEDQNFHLIWVLQNMPDDKVIEFLNLIAIDYKWIVNKIFEEYNSNSDNSSCYLAALKCIQTQFQRNTQYNVHRTKKFLTLRTALRNLSPLNSYNSVVLLGGLSSGKKWLAVDVCSDYGVLKRMKFNIFWIDCSECTSPEQDYEQLKVLMIKLNLTLEHDNHFDKFSYENLLRLKEHLKLKLKEKGNNKCLLVLANVQSVKCLEAFNLNCKRLIITRNRKVSDSLSSKVNIHIILDEGLRLKEFYLLIDKYKSNKYDWREDSKELANDIYHMSLGEPSMLSQIAAKISERKSNWLECMANINNFKISDKKLQRDIAKSFQFLNQNEFDLLATFAVFPRCAQIPVKLLAYLWRKQSYDAEKIVKKFHDYFFVQKRLLDDNDTIVCCVKFVYSSYINNCCEMLKLINAEELHSRIVEYYQVEEHLNNRKDVDLDFESHDGYFYRWIGHHLLFSKYKHLFSKLYKDFGFLGQKMRVLGLHDTIDDLDKYDQEISTGNGKYSLRKFKNFLAKLEEKIIHFHDCSLLQYALFSSEDFIRELALQQIEKFPRRLWFSERVQLQQWRYIFKLTQIPKFVRLLDDDLCITVLANNDTFLVDLALGSKFRQLPLMRDTNIVDIKLFNNKNNLLTLDRYGGLKLWDITEEKRRILSQRHNRHENSNHSFACVENRFICKQTINMFIPSGEKVESFYLTDCNSKEYIILVALNNGMIRFYDWNQTTKEFEMSHLIAHRTTLKNIHSICIVKSHYMIFYYTENNTIDTVFIKKSNTEQEKHKFNWPENDKLLYYNVYDNYVLLIFQRVVMRLTLTFHPVFQGHLEELYQSPYCNINCGKLLLNNKYLMLGTQRGIYIFKIDNPAETLQSIVSENINTVDNYDLDDNEFKSMIVCGCSNKNILYIFGLRLTSEQTLVWEHSSAYNSSEELGHLEQLKNAKFIGHRLFDICEENDTLYAVDSNNKIHQICCTETKNWSILSPPDVEHKIIGIHSFKNTLFVAFNNGAIYDYLEKRLIFRVNEISQRGFLLNHIDDKILIISSACEKTYIKFMTSGRELIFRFQTKFCKLIMENRFLMVNNYGAVVISDYEGNFDLSKIIKSHGMLASCDFKNNLLFLGFSSYEVHIYSLENDSNGDLWFCKRSAIPPNNSLHITCLIASDNAKLLAVGIDTSSSNGLRARGDIEIFKLDDDNKAQIIYRLTSHIERIYDLRFSPQNDVLVSVGEQICFWNVNYVLNNPLDVGNKKRHSSRFTSQKSSEEVDFKADAQWRRRDRFLNIDANESQYKFSHDKTNSIEQSVSFDEQSDDNVFGGSVEKNDETSWSCLIGPCDKPELLSCLKLDGSKAKQIYTNKNFTQFYTVDDEGVFYNFERIKPSLPPIIPEDFDMPDSFSSSIDIADVHRLSIDSSTMSGTDVVDTANT